MSSAGDRAGEPAARQAGYRGWWPAVDLAAGGLAADLVLYVLSTVFAAVTAITATLLPHRAWAAVAVWGYACAALAAAAQLMAPGFPDRVRGMPARTALTWLTWGTTALLPLLVQAVQRAGGRTDRAQEEVLVVEQAGQRLLEHGTPYLARDAIAAAPEAERLLDYLPYQPGMALFGLPRAAVGAHWWTDARVWFAVATAAALLAALHALRAASTPVPRPAAPPVPRPAPPTPRSVRRDARLVRAVQAATVLPVCALTLATGGDDLPVLALCLLAFAWSAGCQPGRAGLAVGLAGTLKLFAWPVALVLLVHALTRGQPAGARFAAGALGLPVAAVLPALLVDPGALAENVVRFPLGHGLVTSPAQSPFPGHLIASGLPAGRAVAGALLAAAGLAIAVGLLRSPPRTAAAAAGTSGYGLLVAILLMPATRFGYLLYPVAFLVWAGALRFRLPRPDPHRARRDPRRNPAGTAAGRPGRRRPGNARTPG